MNLPYEHKAEMPCQVIICVTTCGRPEEFERNLSGLCDLRFHDSSPQLRFLVVDNDPLETGAQVRNCIDRYKDRLDGPIEYLAENQRGISQARNCALQRAHDLDYLAFLDDDEVPTPEWLDELLRIQMSYDADVVTGPVIPRFYEPPPTWVTRGKFFDRPRFETGTPRRVAGCGNVLIRGSAIRESGLRFDDRYTHSGGEDTLFFRQMVDAGYRIIWADEAIVYEWNRPERVCTQSLLARWFRLATIRTRVDRELSPTSETVCHITRIGVRRMVRGLAQLITRIRRPHHLRLQALKIATDGAGRLFGLVGPPSRYYGTVHSK